MLPFPPPVVGTSLGNGIIICQFAKSDGGLARIELGRSQFRHASSPSFIPYVMSSLSYLVMPEPPLYVNLANIMGLTHFDSDDDDESNLNQIYRFKWRQQASPAPDHCVSVGDRLRAMPFPM